VVALEYRRSGEGNEGLCKREFVVEFASVREAFPDETLEHSHGLSAEPWQDEAAAQ